jgi:predicted dehydrogenase
MAGGGTLITQGSHFLDIALWALGGEALSAAGYTAQRKFKDIEVEDVAQGIVEMKSGALVQITSSMAAAREQAATIEVYGNEGTAVYTDRPFLNLKLIGRKRYLRQAPPVRGVHALQRSLEAFAAWIQDGPPHLVTVKEALPVLAVVEAIYTAARTGQRTGIRIKP